MPVDIDTAEKVIKEAKKFTPRQWAIIIFLIVSSVLSAFWVETRYAKIKEIDQRFSKNQQLIDMAYFLSLEMFDRLSDEEKRAIMQKQQLDQLTKSKQNKN